MRKTPRQALPEHQRALLAALGRFLRGHTEATVPASQQLSRGPAAFVLYAMFLHTVQQGRALQELCIVGNAIAARLIARAMVSAVLGLLLIAEQDSDARALLFAEFQGTVRRQRAAALVKYGHLTQQRADELEAEQVAEETKALAAHAAAGTRPAARLGRARTGWSGLSDRALAERFNRLGWYDLLYGPMSDQSHVNAAAIGNEVSELLAGNVTIGGTFDSPFLVVLAACETVSHASEAVDSFFSLGSTASRAGLDREMMEAIGRFAGGRQA